MAKFEEEKVINALHPEKAEVGKKYWGSDELIYLKEEVEKEKTPSKLKCVNVGLRYPFALGSVSFQFLYPYEEPPKQRMTNIQLMEWLAKGNGMLKFKNSNDYCYTYYIPYYTPLENELNEEVIEDIVIRTWDSEECIEPTYEIYERDCKNE